MYSATQTTLHFLIIMMEIIMETAVVDIQATFGDIFNSILSNSELKN